MHLTLIKNVNVINGSKIIKNAWLLCGKKIIAIGHNHPPKAKYVYSYKNFYASAGWIDLHTHGAGGKCFNEASFNALNIISKTLARHGVANYLLTLSGCSLDTIEKNSTLIKKAKLEGAKILGINLEGPFMNMKRRGATPRSQLRHPEETYNQAVFAVTQNQLKLISIAPEFPGAEQAIKYFAHKGAIVSIGHSNAKYKDTLKGFEWGITHSVHLFNAMLGLHHREPGTVGAILSNDEVSTELICDGRHIHPDIVRLVFKIKPFDKICLVTDSLNGAGSPNLKKFIYLRQLVNVRQGVPYLKRGTIAGSLLTLDNALVNVKNWLNLTVPKAVELVTKNPAHVLRLKNKGTLAKNKDADITIFDGNFRVKAVFSQGEKIYGYKNY